MPGPLTELVPLLIAQAAPKAAPDAANSIVQFLPLILIGVVFYFLLLRPQQSQEKRRRQMIDAVKRNDRVVTTGGLYGTVVSIDQEAGRVVLRVDDDKGVKLEFSKQAIAQVLTADKESDREKSAATK